MDFNLPEELQMLEQAVRRFVDKEIIPNEMQCRQGNQIKPEVREKLERKTRDMGLWLIDVPKEYGGAGLGLLARVIIWEQMGRTVAIPARDQGIFGPWVNPILYALNEEQKQRYFYPVLRGEKMGCLAQTEPDAGSDPSAIKTRAVRQGDYYVINGTKRFISHAARATFAQVMAVTDPAKGARGGISCLLVDMDTPGCRITSKYKTMMGDEPCEVVFEDCKVPAANLVGKEGEGFVLGQKWLGVGRLRQAARALGVAERCIEMGARYAKQRVTFGQPLSERQAIQWMLADSYMELHASRLIVYHAAWNYDQRVDIRNEAHVAKVYANEMSLRVVDRVIQIHGGVGLTTELPLHQWFLDQRSMLITDGPVEVMRMAIARHVLKRYA